MTLPWLVWKDSSLFVVWFDPWLLVVGWIQGRSTLPFLAAECFSPLPGKQPPLGIKHGWGRASTKIFTSSSSGKQSHRTEPRLSMRAKLVISYANGGAGSFRGKVCLKSRVHVFANGRYQLSQVLWSTSITLSIFIANDFSRSNCLLQLLETSPQKSFFAHTYKVCTFHNESFFL